MWEVVWAVWSEGGEGRALPASSWGWGERGPQPWGPWAEPWQGTARSLVGSELSATRGMQAEALGFLVGLLSRVPGRCRPAMGGGPQGPAVPTEPRLLSRSLLQR